MSHSSTVENNLVSTSPVQNVGQWTKNLSYWLGDGSIIIRVTVLWLQEETILSFHQIEGVLYKIHVSLLTQLSPNLAEILSILHGPVEEGTELLPLHIAGLAADSELTWKLESREWSPMINLEERECVLKNLLKVCSLWGVAVGKNYAKLNLEGIYLDLSRRLELAKQYSIHEWVPGVIDKIFQGKLTDLNDLDLAHMGIECTKHNMCVATWKRLWDRIGRKLLQPDTPIQTTEILAEVKRLSNKDLNKKCHLDIVRDIEHTIVFVDQRVIAGVINSIIAYHKNP
ncbi:hypothetical protein DFH08DRAFT_825860 [Mycena albidolilacea]|uniref:Uncharacterized protein n=1 Tax=Mycena albidolilacea TaxID=1033008 RepID=A0AAD7E8V3_9AGAR|nr:hypothetical protein DFH08DRAFT_825860 [Mycena albidolilacea]